ncbi:MAG: hypothetical protein HOA06_06525, partial [Chloroflexi bacterium]|nr:hypothetical protein [Chloroflexota bacterium]
MNTERGNRKMYRLLALVLLTVIAVTSCATPDASFAFDEVGVSASPSQKELVRFRTFFVTRSLAHERLIPHLEAARPQIVQVGNYGAMFHGYADNPKSMKSPMMLPVAGERAALEFQQKL